MCAKTIKINEDFQCAHCYAHVQAATTTCRNHCNWCLWSIHVDHLVPGDRASKCRGLMEPIKVEKNQKGLVIIHRCIKCNYRNKNRALEDDNWEKIIELSQFPHL